MAVLDPFQEGIVTLLVGSLFSGIGGFDYGLERAGMRVAWQCEADEFCRRVLAERWPGVPCYADVRELRDPEPIDVLCGGFPCQDISLAGKGAGIDGARSGLWGEYARLVGELRPRYVIVENVAALLSRGLGRVVGDLAALGYDAEWDCIPASALGAPHRRDRLWLIAYPAEGGRGPEQPDLRARESDAQGGGGDVADTERGGRSGWPQDPGRGSTDGEAQERREGAAQSPRRDTPQGASGAVSDADTWRREIGSKLDGQPEEDPADRHPRGGHANRLRDEVADAEGDGRGSRWEGRPLASGEGERESERALQDADERALQPWRIGGRAAQAGGAEWWAVEPPVGRVAHGVPDRLDQLAALGNALVPQIAEWLGRRILDYEGQLVTELVA